jgi:hypothetical protein
MQVTAPIYEKPSRLSQGLVAVLSVAVVAMSGWLVMTIMDSEVATTAAGSVTDATASPPVEPGAGAASPADATPASSASGALRPAARSVQFDWPEEFNSAATRPPRTALPLAPADLPVTRDAGRATWPSAAAVLDNDPAFAARLPPTQPAATPGASVTDAIVDLLAPPSGARDASAAPPLPRPVPTRR